MFNQSLMHETLTSILKQKEAIFMKSIVELINDGILKVEEGEAFLVQDQTQATIQYRQSIKIISKEHEVIERLKKENEELKAALSAIRKVVNV